MSRTMYPINPCDALIVVDVQNDFCPGGALAVPRGDEVVPIINALMPRFETVIFTRDWHPKGHISFASSHQGKKPHEVIKLPYGNQMLWNDHCVQGTPGADYHNDLVTPDSARLWITKGFHADSDSYSTFSEANGRTTGLSGYLDERGISHVFLVGLATDFCVAFSAIDAVRNGFTACVIGDACRAIDVDGSLQRARASMRKAGVILTTLDYVA